MPGGCRLIARVAPLGLLVGCGAATPPPRPPPPRVVAILPARWENSLAALQLDGARDVGRGVARAGARPVGAPVTDAACWEDPTCVRRAARDARASKAITIRLAALGDTVLVRVAVLDVERGTQEQTRQELVRDATAQNVAAALERVGAAVALPWAPPAPEADDDGPGFAWIAAGSGLAIAAGAAIAIGVAAASSSESRPPSETDRPDIVITPP